MLRPAAVVIKTLQQEKEKERRDQATWDTALYAIDLQHNSGGSCLLKDCVLTYVVIC